MTPNIFAEIPLDLQSEAFQLLEQGAAVRIERIVSHGHRSAVGFWYEQLQAEWVLLLRGRAIVRFENGRDEQLGEGDYLNIPAGCRHRVEWTDPAVDTIWLAIHYS